MLRQQASPWQLLNVGSSRRAAYLPAQPGGVSTTNSRFQMFVVTDVSVKYSTVCGVAGGN